jgi:hypothetical protein
MLPVGARTAVCAEHVRGRASRRLGIVLRAGPGGNAAWEDRRRPTREHLERGNRDPQAGDDLDASRDRDQGEQQHNRAEVAPAQARHWSDEGEMIRRRLIEHPLKYR